MRTVTLENLVDFIRILRVSGLRLGLSEDIDAIRGVAAAKMLGETLRNPDLLREILRISLVKDPEQYGLFDRLFDSYWVYGEERQAIARRVEVRIYGEASTPDPVKKFISIYSPLEVRGRVPKKAWPDPRGRMAMRRIFKVIERRIPTEPGVRRKVSARGELDFPRSYRDALSTLGDLVRLRRSVRKRARTRFVIAIDVSGSMEDSWESILRLLGSLRGFSTRRYEVFLFSTDILRITDSIAQGIERLKNSITRSGIWGSGTKIGESLYKLVTSYRGYVGNTSVVIIISDGWDLGDLGLLEKSLMSMRRIAGKILWLSPHAGKSGFSPETACLRIALRYVDAILPIEILYDMAMLRRYMRSNRHVFSR